MSVLDINKFDDNTLIDEDWLLLKGFERSVRDRNEWVYRHPYRLHVYLIVYHLKTKKALCRGEAGVFGQYKEYSCDTISDMNYLMLLVK